MAELEALGLTVRQELVQLDLDRGVIGARRQLDNVRDLRGLIIGLDRRPADGRVYALTGLTEMTEHMSLLPLPAGAAQGAAFDQAARETRLDLPLPSGVRIAFDPVQDNLRAVTPEGRSFRIDPNNGSLREDVNLLIVPAQGQPEISAIAYGNAWAGAQRAPLYLIDIAQQALLIEDPRQPGRLDYIGSFQVPLRRLSAFRIFSDREGRNSGLVVDGNRIYTLDLLTAQAWDRAYFGSEDLVLIDMAFL